jgi:beta-glucanase (GH16 family)
VEPIFNGDSTITLKTEHNPKSFYQKKEGGYWYENEPPGYETKIDIPFSAGGLSTNPSFRQRYGRWECRCRVPVYNGCKAAYWMWGSTWPPEIDVFESDKSDSQQINLHYGSNAEGNKDSIKAWDSKSLRPGEWQEFAVVWTPEKIEMYTDGIKIFRFTNKETLEWFNADNAQMWVVLTQYVIHGNMFTEDKTSEFDVDYIRVYK